MIKETTYEFSQPYQKFIITQQDPNLSKEHQTIQKFLKFCTKSTRRSIYNHNLKTRVYLTMLFLTLTSLTILLTVETKNPYFSFLLISILPFIAYSCLQGHNSTSTSKSGLANNMDTDERYVRGATCPIKKVTQKKILDRDKNFDFSVKKFGYFVKSDHLFRFFLKNERTLIQILKKEDIVFNYSIEESEKSRGSMKMFKISFKVVKERLETGIEVLQSSSRLNLGHFRMQPMIKNLRPTSYHSRRISIKGLKKTQSINDKEIEIESGEICSVDRDEGLNFPTRGCKTGIGMRSRLILDQFRNPLTNNKPTVDQSTGIAGSIGVKSTRISVIHKSIDLTKNFSCFRERIEKLRKQKFNRTNLSSYPGKNYIKKKYTLFEYDSKIKMTTGSDNDQSA